jgi:hypothetical protein
MLQLSTTSLTSLSTVRISKEGSVYHGRIGTSRIIKGWQRPIQARAFGARFAPGGLSTTAEVIGQTGARGRSRPRGERRVNVIAASKLLWARLMVRREISRNTRPS